ncbi:hypothetical protein PED39_05525 [Methanomassiliicoccales archaeon LGM-RCC1]|nr:hypothetical protein PED39_05525 [Methanomassiliicoccales archaeon LGM-RCC1]
MTLPQLMIRRWDGVGYGDKEEFFTFGDMNRCEYNANLIAQEAGMPTVEFIETTRASQFRFDEMQKLENLIAAIASEIGVSISPAPVWFAGRSVSYVDFERVEANTYTVYQALGGVGDRVESHQFLVTAHATLFANEWQGNGPYYIDLTMPAIHPGRDAIAYVDHNASFSQHVAAVNAILRAQILGERTVRVTALSLRPEVNIPIKVTVGMMEMSTDITLSAAGWSGSGPYTQEVTLSDVESVADAIVGPCDSTTNAQAIEIARCGLVVTGLTGNKVEITALFAEPSIDLKAGILHNHDEVEE